MNRVDSEGSGRPAAAVTVFAPTPLLTVTIEVELEGEAPDIHVHAGGQGFWVARMLSRLGVQAELCAPCGGDTGALIRVLVEAEGVGLRAIDSAHSNGGYVHDRRGGSRKAIVETAGQTLSRHEIDDLYDVTFVSALRSGLLVLTGQHPEAVMSAGVYERLARDVRSNAGRVVGDLTGEDLRCALKSGLDLLCISHEELVDEGYSAGDGPRELIAGMRRLQADGARVLVVHRGAEPTFALLEDRLVEIVAPSVTPLDPRGGGDTFLAGLVGGLVSGLGMEEALKLGAAAGCLNVTRRGLGTGTREEIVALSERVELRGLHAPG